MKSKFRWNINMNEYLSRDKFYILLPYFLESINYLPSLFLYLFIWC